MKSKLAAALAVLTLSACSTTQQFDFVVPAGKPVLGVGGVTVTSTYTKQVLSGNAQAIPAGQPGAGGEGSSAN